MAARLRSVCDTLCALPSASATGAALFAKNSDRPRGEPQDLEWHPPRRDDAALRTTYLSIPGSGGDTVGCSARGRAGAGAWSTG